MALVTIGKISRVNQAEGGGRQQLSLFAFAGRSFNQLGRIPFAEINPVPLQFQPSLEQINLGRFAGAIQSLNRDQAAGKVELGERL